MTDKIFDYVLDDVKERYFFMQRQEKLNALQDLRRRDDIFSSAFYIVTLIMWFAMGFSVWATVSVALMSTDLGMLEPVMDVIPFVLFSVALFFEAAALRTNSRKAMLVFLVTMIAAIVINNVFMLVLLWLLLYYPTWKKFQAMREVPGYPNFPLPDEDSSQYTLTERQYTAYVIKKHQDMDNPDEAKLRNSENLEKILSGEMSLDDYLKVEDYTCGMCDEI